MTPMDTARDHLAADHQDRPPCPWSYLGAPCVLTRGHPTPHWLEVEQSMLPDAEKALELMRRAPARAAADE
jgi:hypothetical protein